MNSTPLRSASKLLFAIFSLSTHAADDATWNSPGDGASYAENTTANSYNSVPFSIDLKASTPGGYSIQVYAGTSLLGSLSFQGIVGGRRTFAGRIPISNAGSYLLTAKTTDGFTETVIDGPTITVVNSGPATTYYEDAPTSITAVSAVLNGRVDSHGRAVNAGGLGNPVFSAWEGQWEIGTSTSYGTIIGGGAAYGSYPHVHKVVAGQALASSLLPATTYHYRFVGVGMVGPDQVFTTQPNNPPLLRDDYGIVDRTGTSEIYVLENDEDETVPLWARPLPVVEIAQQPQDGTVQLSQAGNFRIRYTPGPSFSGADEFTYLVRDAFGGESTAKVRVYSPGKFYEAVGGNYSGAVVYDGQHLQTFSLSVARSGAFSGMLNYFGAQMPFTGQLRQTEESGPEGANVYLPRPGFLPLRVMVGAGFDYYNPSIPSVRVYISDEAASREFEFENAPANVTARDLVPEAGNFNATMLNPEASSLDSASQGTQQTTVDADGHPQGHGFSHMRVSTRGRTIVRGKTGDHIPFTSGATMRKDHKILLKSRLGSAKKGTLIGLVGFDAAQAKASGDLRWLNTARNSGAYLAGFDLSVAADAKKITAAPKGVGILLFPEGSARLVKVSVGNHHGDLLATATMPLVKGKLDNGPGQSFRLRLSVNEKTGLFSGNLEISGNKLPISGVVRPGERKGLGIAGKPGFDGPVELKALDDTSAKSPQHP